MRVLLLTAYGLLLTFTLTADATAQEPVPGIPDDADVDVEAGLQIYADRCATCHGPAGLGDGPLAAQAINPPPAIGSPAYLETADARDMFNLIANGNFERGMPGFGAGVNQNDPLTAGEIWSVIAALPRLQAQNKPIAAGQISGRVVNASTGTAGANLAGKTVTLQAFTPEFEEALTLETELDATGRFTFDLSLVPPTWVYRVVVAYQGLDFTSNFEVLDRDDPALDLSVQVYEQTTDPAAVRIEQLDVIVEFVEDQVRINELYTFSNQAAAVFVGETGDYAAGTVDIALPAGVENVSFLRGIGGPTDFIPADEDVVKTGAAWSATIPLSPGPASLRLLARYELPYERGLTVVHPVQYPAASVMLLVPDERVSLEGGAWQARPVSAVDPAIEQFGRPVRYQRPPLAAGETLEFTLSGRPRVVSDRQGNAILARDEQTELIVGGLALLVAAAAAVYLAARWRNRPPPANERDVLLQTLAALDEAYAEDRIRKSSYQRRRRQIKERLAALWEQEAPS